MAYGLDSEDVLAVCLILAGGDLDATAGVVGERADILEGAIHDHFGEAEGDLTSALFWLAVSAGLVGWPGDPTPFESLRAVRLRDLARPMLEQADVWFNDEGEYRLSRADAHRPPTARTAALRALIDSDTSWPPEAVLTHRSRLGRRFPPERDAGRRLGP